jgi:hypothetical protein
MTTENQVFMSLDEIKGIRFGCSKCHAKLTLPLRNLNLSSIPMTCVCGEQWFQGHHDERLRAVATLISRLNEVRDAQLPVSLNLEVANPSFSFRASNGKD